MVTCEDCGKEIREMTSIEKLQAAWLNLLFNWSIRNVHELQAAKMK